MGVDDLVQCSSTERLGMVLLWREVSFPARFLKNSEDWSAECILQSSFDSLLGTSLGSSVVDVVVC